MKSWIWISMMAMAALAQQPPPLVPLDKLSIPKADEGVENADQPQAASLGGNALFGVKDKEGKIAAALSAMEKDPKNPELRLAAGRAMDAYLRFRESTPLYEDGMTRFADDYRFARMYGHRQISLRNFSGAVTALEKAVKLAPNSFDSAYYLGLALYFKGDHARAAEILATCEAQIDKPLAEKADLKGGRSCDSLGKDANWLVGLQYWRFLALRRAGDTAGAKKYLDTRVKDDLTISSSKPFYDALLFFKGKKEINDMLADANEGTRDSLTRTSAAATFLFTEGERAKACGIWARNAMDQNWDHIGVITAEAEYFQNSKTACSFYMPAAPKKQ